jgi:hypothetical protein
VHNSKWNLQRLFEFTEKPSILVTMKTQTGITKKGYVFERSTYNPALDHLMSKELCKDKVDSARAFLKEHGLPKRFYEKDKL